jgi:hypothetical protein
LDKETHDKLRYVQALLSHAVPPGDIAQLLGRALDALIPQLERRKIGAVSTRAGRRLSGRTRARYLPAHVRRAVWERDGGRCTFIGANGHRCNTRTLLEFDHVEPYARGGQGTLEELRLRCRAHNQHEAERAFGCEFMERKRREAMLAAEAARSRSREEERARSAAEAELKGQMRDVLAALRGLGIRGEKAQHAAAHAETLQGASLPERIRAALEFHGEGLMRSPRAARALYASG